MSKSPTVIDNNTKPKQPSFVSAVSRISGASMKTKKGFSILQNIEKLLANMIRSPHKVKPLSDIVENDDDKYISHHPGDNSGSSKKRSYSLDNTLYIKCLLHELRTPITNISIGLHLIKEQIENKDTQTIVIDTIDGLEFLKNVITKFAMVQNGNLVLNPFEPFSFQTMMDEINTLLTYKLAEYNVACRYHIDPNVSVWLFGDAHNIQHVIINLLKNAIKYRDINRINTVVVNITAEPLISGEQIVRISIKDGNDHLLPHIKEKLFQAFNTTTGSGLGLYICKTITELHDGEISHHFIDQVGNEFIVLLPLKIVDIPNNHSKNRLYNVLHVDDSALTRKLMCKFLLTVPLFEVIYSAENGTEAMKQMEKNANNIHVVLVDKNMPVMNGYNTVKAMRNACYTGLIFGLTGDNSQDDIDGFIMCGADYVFVKPFDGIQLILMRKFIEKYGPERPTDKKIKKINNVLEWV